jgi:hypothetical protein
MIPNLSQVYPGPTQKYNYTSVTITRIFRILVGIFGFGSFVRDRLLENFRVGYFVWELSFGILRLGTFAWDLSFGNFRLGSFASKRSLGNFRLGTFALDPSPKQAILRLGTFFGIFGLGTFV